MKATPSTDDPDAAVALLPSVARALTVAAGCRFLFVVLEPEVFLDTPLWTEIHRCATALGDLPNAIYAAPDLPRAADGQLLGAAVRRVLAGEPPARVAVEERVANPASLQFFAFLFNNL